MKKILFLIPLLFSTNIFATSITNKHLELRKKLENQTISFPQAFYEYGKTKEIISEINRVKDWYDFDKDGALDYLEIYRNFTDPKNPDTDNDGILDGDFKESMEYTYTVCVDLRLIKPYDIEYMDKQFFQEVEVVEETDEYIDIKLYIYPYTKFNETITSNKNWKQDNLEVKDYVEYMKNNYDPELKQKILKDLNKAGIYPDKLSDKKLVSEVCNYIRSFRQLKDLSTDYHMWDWFVEKDGENYKFTNASFENDFITEQKINITLKEFNKKYNKQYTEQDLINLIGDPEKQFDEKIIGSCSSQAKVASLIFNSIGIPCKSTLIQTIYDVTNINKNDDLYKYNYEKVNKITNEHTKKHILKGIEARNGSGHSLNQIYIGNQWYLIDIPANRYNVEPIYNDQVMFALYGDYDYSDKFLQTCYNFASRLKDYDINKISINKKFNETYKKNNIESLGYKFFDINDFEGNHIKKEIKDFINSYQSKIIFIK